MRPPPVLKLSASWVLASCSEDAAIFFAFLQFAHSVPGHREPMRFSPCFHVSICRKRAHLIEVRGVS